MPLSFTALIETMPRKLFDRVLVRRYIATTNLEVETLDYPESNL
jgi:hypothetical protein